jgi:Trypsin-co-occurring domain 2
MSTERTPQNEVLDLADAITLIRDQVAEAERRIADGHDAGVRFTLGEISLEFGLELTRTRGVDGGLRFSVLSLGGKHESSQGATHTLRVQLTPHRNDGGSVDVSDQEDF